MEILVSILISLITTLFIYGLIQGGIILYELRKNKKEKEMERRANAELNQIVMRLFSLPNQNNWNQEILNSNEINNEKDNGTNW